MMLNVQAVVSVSAIIRICASCYRRLTAFSLAGRFLWRSDCKTEREVFSRSGVPLSMVSSSWAFIFCTKDQSN